MNVMEEIVKLRAKFAELHCFFGEVFPNHDKLKEYAQFLETECIMYKEMLSRTTEQE